MYMIVILLSLALVFYSIYRICYNKGKSVVNIFLLVSTSIILYMAIYDGVLKMFNVHNSMM